MELEEKKDKPKKPKKKKPSRTIETMFRSTMSNHLKVSEMADRKAGILVSINSIIISIMTSFMVHEFATNPTLLYPTCFLVLVCLVTITLALYATKPSVKPKQPSSGLPTKRDLLFFGDYLNLSLDEYKAAMKESMLNNDMLYDSLISNIYAQGKVMDRKYKLLQYAYTVFMIGFPIALAWYLATLYVSYSTL